MSFNNAPQEVPKQQPMQYAPQGSPQLQPMQYAPQGSPQQQPMQYVPQGYPQQQPMYYPAQPMMNPQACPPHDFRKTGNWDTFDILACIFLCPWNFCCCPPGQRDERCQKCGLKN